MLQKTSGELKIVPNFHFHVFSTNIDLISMLLKILRGPSSWFGASRFQHFSLQNFTIYKNNSTSAVHFLIYLGDLASPKINHIGFGTQAHVRKSRNHINEGFEGSHISKAKSYKSKLKQNNTTKSF